MFGTVPDFRNAITKRAQAAGSNIDIFALAMSQDPIEEMRTMAMLPPHAQEYIEKEIGQVALERLSLVKSLSDEGLVTPLANWLAIPQYGWNEASKSGVAQAGMVPGGQGEDSQPDMTPSFIPIYCQWETHTISIRDLAAAARAGYDIETNQMQQGVRRINEATEDYSIYGGFQAAGGLKTYGLLTAPNRTVMNAIHDWDDPATTGVQKLNDIIAIRGALHAQHQYDPFNVVVGTTYSDSLDGDFKDLSSISTRERLMEINGLNEIITADRFPANTVGVYTVNKNTIDLIVGQEITNVSWPTASPWSFTTTILQCMVPRVRNDYNGQSGIVIATPT
jgi:uncharacterized linocin/CFP29 family protein